MNSSKVTKNEDERMSFTLLVRWELTAEFKIFNLIIDERIYAEFQPSEQPHGNYDKIILKCLSY